MYVLQKLLDLRLWPGSLWAAFSDDPTKFSSSQPSTCDSCACSLDLTSFSLAASELGLLAPSELIADSVKRSSVAHLFHFYTSLCEIASIPGKTPTAWVSKTSTSLSAAERKRELGAKRNADEEVHDVAEVDARKLARDCLRAVGKEMGVAQ